MAYFYSPLFALKDYEAWCLKISRSEAKSALSRWFSAREIPLQPGLCALPALPCAGKFNHCSSSGMNVGHQPALLCLFPTHTGAAFSPRPLWLPQCRKCCSKVRRNRAHLLSLQAGGWWDSVQDLKAGVCFVFPLETKSPKVLDLERQTYNL